MEGITDAFTDVVVVMAATTFAHFGVEVGGLEPTAREPRAVHRSTAVAPRSTRPGTVVVQRRQAPR